MGVAFLSALYIRSEITAHDKDVTSAVLEGPRILWSVGLVTSAGSMQEDGQRLARFQTVVQEVFSGVLVFERA